MELNRTIIVPSEKHPSIQEGLEDVCMIDQLKLKKGVHRLPFTYPIVSRTISVSGEDETWVIGSWKVSEDGRGRFERLKLANLPLSKVESDNDEFSTFDISDGVWSFYKVCVHNIQGVAIHGSSWARLMMNNCLVGGGSADPNRQAKIGLVISNQGRLELNQSTVAWCENFGIDIDAQTDLKLLECSVRENRIGIQVGNDCVVTVDECEFENAVSSLRIDNKARYTSKIFLRNSSMDEDVWFGGRKPVRTKNDPEDLVGDSIWSSEVEDDHSNEREYTDISYSYL